MEQLTHSSNHWSQEFWSDFISLFYPPICLVCSQGLVRGEDWLCAKCMVRLPRAEYSSMIHNPIIQKLYGRIPIRRATALLKFRKKGMTQKLLHQLKYRNQPMVGVQLGRLLGHEISIHWHPLDLIVPVPLHASRLQKRGYNQSAKLAEGIAEVLGIPYSNHISVRKVNTSTQTKKSLLARWQNVSDVFDVTNRTSIEGKHVLLVDDVMTTGATVEACGASLLAAGCASLSVACIAYAQ